MSMTDPTTNNATTMSSTEQEAQIPDTAMLPVDQGSSIPVSPL